jgi:hypothetical protein
MSMRMSQSAGTSSGGLSARRIGGLRRATLASFVLLVVQYAIGTGVNLYVGAPSGVHGIGEAISKGPAALSVHVVLGLLLVLAAVGLVVQAVIARHWVLTGTSVVGLLALIAATLSGARFVSKGLPSASMAMAILTGVALLAYGANLYLLASAPAQAPLDFKRT